MKNYQTHSSPVSRTITSAVKQVKQASLSDVLQAYIKKDPLSSDSSTQKPLQQKTRMVTQLGKDGKEAANPKKGHDYANNIGKLFRDLHLIGLDDEIDQAIAVIDAYRSQCTALASEVVGEDTNVALYSHWCEEFKKCVSDLLKAIQDSDKGYVGSQLKSLVPQFNTLMEQFLKVTIDSRVKEALYSSSPVARRAIDRIDEALNTIKRRFVLVGLKGFVTVYGGLKEADRTTANNCLINAITDAMGIARLPGDRLLLIRSALVGYEPFDMLNFDADVLEVITQALHIPGGRPIIVLGQRVFVNHAVYLEGTPEYAAALAHPNRIVIYHSHLHFQAVPFS